jgi:hypothetical protein
LSALSKSRVQDDIHFLCIDKRVKAANGSGAWHIITETGEKVLLPPQVNRVPALLLLNKGHMVLYGEQILQHFQPKNVDLNNKATNFNGEPNSFSLGRESMGGFGVASDNYSFLDQSADELSAKGNGGMRQLYNYATIDVVDKIETPPDNYSPDKVGSVSLEQLQQKRQSEIQIQQQQQQNMVVGGPLPNGGSGAMTGAGGFNGGSIGMPGSSQRGQSMPTPQQYAPIGTPPQFAAQSAYRAPPQQSEYSRFGDGGANLRGSMDMRAPPRRRGSWI